MHPLLPAFPRHLWHLGATFTALALAGCASRPAVAPSAPGPSPLHAKPATDVLLGKQHDAPDHQRLQRATVQWLTARGQLAALVLEMAERGSTAALPRDATQAQVQSALQWQDAAWPWSTYGSVDVTDSVKRGTSIHSKAGLSWHMRWMCLRHPRA
jgi:hypothetical protein